MDAVLMDMNEYVRSGEGANGESYFHRSDPRIMVKLCLNSTPREQVEHELEQARRVCSAGISTPEPGELITDGKGRYGIRFERIAGKKSISRAVADEPGKVEEYARLFAGMCRELHEVHLDTDKFVNVKDSYLQMLEESPYFTPEEKDKIRKFIMEVPDTDTAIHGDLQYSNAIIAGDRKYFIDLGDFAYGDPLFDLGMVLVCCKYSDPQFILETFHLDMKTAGEFWLWFVKGYFGEDADPDEVERMLKPYAGLKTLIIERNSKMYFPNFHAVLNDTILA